MDRKAVKTKLISSLLAAVILLVNFNFLPIQSIVSESSYESSITAYAATTKPGTWIKESNGKWWYKHTDGTYTKNDWEYINGYWYHFDASGWMQTGWLKVDGKWYHLNSEGKMHIGWVKIGTDWYFFHSTGERYVGWLPENGKTYHFNSNGIMDIGWKKINGYWYHFDSDGVMNVGWKQLNGNWYYFNSGGVRQVGWQQVDGKWYHLNSEGIMETGWVKIGTDWYYFNSKGIRQTGWLKLNNKWYYFNPNGGTMNTKTFTEDQRKYAFYSSGELRTTEILINRQEQQKDNWCWAACSVMVGTYNTDSRRTQRNVVKEITGSTDDESGTIADTIGAVNYASRDTKSAYSRIIPNLPDYNAVVNKIDNNRPFIIGVTWETGDGHMIVCVGYDNHYKNVRIIDPGRIGTDINETQGIRYYNYNSLLNGADIYNDGNIGLCTAIVMY